MIQKINIIYTYKSLTTIQNVSGYFYGSIQTSLNTVYHFLQNKKVMKAIIDKDWRYLDSNNYFYRRFRKFSDIHFQWYLTIRRMENNLPHGLDFRVR